jgi:FtsZ-interacting cell division protein YlmF
VARKGDLIVVNPRRVGGPAREGEIIEVIEGDLRVQYRVRWNDGHESLFAPGAGAARIEPARDRKKTRSEGTEPKKSPAKASTARKSTAKKSTAKTTTTKKSAARKSTVRKVVSKRAASRGPSGRR